MKLKKVISGGQTGADQAGIIEAYRLGLETGGTMPRGWKTENGPNPAFGKAYGLVESASDDYKTRTRMNVANADVTLWFGNVGSPGFKCTARASKDYNKPFVINPTPGAVLDLAGEYEVFNIAGNRESTNPSVVKLVKLGFSLLTK